MVGEPAGRNTGGDAAADGTVAREPTHERAVAEDATVKEVTGEGVAVEGAAERLRRENERLRERLDARRRERERIVERYEDLLAMAQGDRPAGGGERTDVVWSRWPSAGGDPEATPRESDPPASGSLSAEGSPSAEESPAAARSTQSRPRQVTPPEESVIDRLLDRLRRR